MKKRRIKGYDKNKTKYKNLRFIDFDYSNMFDDAELFED